MAQQKKEDSLYSLDYFAGKTPDSPFEKDGSYLEVGSEHLTWKYQQLLNWINPKSQSKILDVGCGPGHLHHTATALDLDIRITGLELHKDVADFATSKGADVIVGDMTCPPEELLRQSFDILILNDVIEHVSQSEALSTLSILKESLTPQGKLFLRSPSGKCVWTDKYWKDIDHKHMYSNEEIVELVSKAGFTNINITTIGHPDTQDFYTIDSDNCRPQGGAIILLSAQNFKQS